MAKTTTLQDFNADLGRRRALAAACEKNPDYLYLVGKGFKRASTNLAKCIDTETARIWRRVPKESLRPDVWEVEVNNQHRKAREVERAKEGKNNSPG